MIKQNTHVCVLVCVYVRVFVYVRVLTPIVVMPYMSRNTLVVMQKQPCVCAVLEFVSAPTIVKPYHGSNQLTINLIDPWVRHARAVFARAVFCVTAGGGWGRGMSLTHHIRSRPCSSAPDPAAPSCCGA